jgi:hypothetical protein
MLYLGLTIFLFLLRYALGKHVVVQKPIYYVVLLSLFVFSAFRYQVGCDWSGNYSQYTVAADFDWSTLTNIREPIWWAILAWMNASDLPYPIANVISSAVFFGGIHILARRQPDPLGFLVLLFPILIINMPMSGIRQGAAIGLLAIAFTAFIDRRPLKYMFWVFMASGFHSSAIVFMILLPMVTGIYTRRRLILGAVLAVPGFYLLASTAAADVAASRYINSGNDEAAGAAFRAGLLTLSALYFFLFVRKKWQVTWSSDYSLVSIGAIGMALVLLLVPISTVIGDRFGYYLIPIQAMIFARLPFLPFRRNASLHSALPYLGLLFFFIVWAQLSSLFEQCYSPYQTWLFGFPSGDSVGV